ncbi:MAG TPA: T9SS type A sorting domain-containing protein [Lentimicrobium sp.]|nr:T9SS type A sorting domain-containing protein [Lentimicrobium sp.]
MKKLLVIITILTLLVSQTIRSQDITKSVIGSCGQTQSSEGNRISWTVGEPVIGTMTGGGHQIGNGFYSSLDLSVLITAEKEQTSNIEVYPNPASEFITCRSNPPGQLKLVVTSVEGMELINTSIFSGDKVYMNNLKEGIYLLKVTELLSKKTNTYKLVLTR